MDNTQYGVLHEVGDYGLGFDPLNKKDNQVYHESLNIKKDTDQQSINEDNNKKD